MDSVHKGPEMQSFDRLFVVTTTNYWTISQGAGDLSRHDA